MIEHGVDVARNPVSSDTSGDRKRSLSAGADGYDDNAKRRNSDVYSTMSLPVGHTDTCYSYPRSSNGGVHTCSYPISSLYYSSSPKDDEAGYNGSYSSQSRSLSADRTSHRSSSYRQAADSNGGYDRSTRASTTEGFGFPSPRPSSVTEQGYPGQYDFHDHPYSQEGDTGRRNGEGNPPRPLHIPPPTERNRFNLSRYQLDDDEDLSATIADQSDVTEDVKPNRFKTLRERLMQSRAEDSENSDSTARTGFVETFSSLEGEDSTSCDNVMSQRERLRQFRNDYSHHMVIPNQWEGEKNLHEFVAFGNIEAALRPLGLMMARAALVNDSVTTRHHRSSSSGPSDCHSNRSNPLQARSSSV